MKPNNNRRWNNRPTRPERSNQDHKPTKTISPLASDAVRIIPFGGTEEIGRNMTAIEYKDTIIVIGAGIQFNESKTPGVDFIIPNTSYLEDNKHKIKAVLLTNSKQEHIGALPYIAKNLGTPTLYARHYTKGILERQFAASPDAQTSQIVPIEENMTITIGDLATHFWNINSSSADSFALSFTTPGGEIVYTNSSIARLDTNQFADFANKKVLCLLADSANAEQPGKAPSFSTVVDNLKKVIDNAKHRVFVSTFPSNVEHIIATLDIAESLKKKVAIDSQTVQQALEVAQEIGLAKSYKDTIIDAKDIDNYKKNELVIFVTGTEGDEFEDLTKIANKAHKLFAVEAGDIVIIAANAITHNQRMVQKLKDNLSRQGAHTIHYKGAEVLLTDSGNSEDLEALHRALTPQFFIPVQGCHYMLRVHADIERKMGTPENHIIIPDNGMVIEIRENGTRITNTREKVPTDMVVLDGISVGKVKEVVIRDRETLSQQGVFIIMCIIDGATHRLKKAPDIASRGFVYLKESQELLLEARNVIKTTVDGYLEKNRQLDIDRLKVDLQTVVGKFLLQKTAKEPVIIPVIIKL